MTDLLPLITGLTGIVTGVIGLVIGLLSYKNSKFSAINDFFVYMRDTEFIKARQFVYNMPKNEIIKKDSPDDADKYVSMIINAYHHWGLLLKHNQLPMWLFYERKTGLTASGIAVIRLYTKLVATINDRRGDEDIKNKNSKYADYFKWLYDKLIQLDPSYNIYL